MPENARRNALKVKQQPVAGVLPLPNDAKNGKGKKPQAGKDGLYTHTGKNVPLCKAFNAGNCQKSAAKCPTGHAHQCNKCLRNNHAGKDCKGKAIK